jgi:hypothetical protein
MDPDGSGMRVFASGLRNPNGMDWAPGTRILWTVVNERDELGDDLVPDYLTSVREGAFYGWPYSYFAQNKDPRKKGERPDLVAKAVIPDLAIGAHTASLGLTFYDASAFPDRSGSRSCRTARCSSRTTAETSSGGLRILDPARRGRARHDFPRREADPRCSGLGPHLAITLTYGSM